MKTLLTVLFALSISFNYADSPLTSTNFSKAYESEAMIQSALNSNGKLTTIYCDFLYSKKNKIAKKVALINALSWNIDGKMNFDIYFEYLVNTNKKITYENYKTACTADQLICLAYLKSLDDYFDVKDALTLADNALEKSKNSYTIHIIHGLIKSQDLFDTDWCGVYRATNEVRENSSLKKDMNSEAIQIIFEYMDLYEDDCIGK